jgi:hypothetical protein
MIKLISFVIYFSLTRSDIEGCSQDLATWDEIEKLHDESYLKISQNDTGETKRVKYLDKEYFSFKIAKNRPDLELKMQNTLKNLNELSPFRIFPAKRNCFQNRDKNGLIVFYEYFQNNMNVESHFYERLHVISHSSLWRRIEIYLKIARKLQNLHNKGFAFTNLSQLTVVHNANEMNPEFRLYGVEMIQNYSHELMLQDIKAFGELLNLWEFTEEYQTESTSDDSYQNLNRSSVTSQSTNKSSFSYTDSLQGLITGIANCKGSNMDIEKIIKRLRKLRDNAKIEEEPLSENEDHKGFKGRVKGFVKFCTGCMLI